MAVLPQLGLPMSATNGERSTKCKVAVCTSGLRGDFNQLGFGLPQCKGRLTHSHHHGVAPDHGFAQDLNLLAWHKANVLELSGQPALGLERAHGLDPSFFMLGQSIER